MRQRQWKLPYQTLGWKWPLLSDGRLLARLNWSTVCLAHVPMYLLVALLERSTWPGVTGALLFVPDPTLAPCSDAFHGMLHLRKGGMAS
jgi:hypothetical protein